MDRGTAAERGASRDGESVFSGTAEVNQAFEGEVAADFRDRGVFQQQLALPADGHVAREGGP